LNYESLSLGQEFLYLQIQKLKTLNNTGLEILTKIGEVFGGTTKKIVVVPHENPDGDAIGAALGLGQVLQNAGHDVNVVSANDYPDFLKWFSSDVPVAIYDTNKKNAKKLVFEADILICVDFNEAKRAGHLESTIEKFDRTKILIDHHPNPTQFCDYTVSETSYSSTAELVFDVISEIGLSDSINEKAAEPLYTGILTDTGGFNHNISKNTFKVVSQLMEYDINTEKIRSEIYNNFSADRMRLLGYSLNEKMQVFPEFRTALISLSKEDLKRFNFKPGDTEGLVNYPLSISNIVFAALFIEKDGYVKASFRSTGDFPANAFSRKNFSGGGHLNAAGGQCDLGLDETIQKFIQLLPEYEELLLKSTI